MSRNVLEKVLVPQIQLSELEVRAEELKFGASVMSSSDNTYYAMLRFRNFEVSVFIIVKSYDFISVWRRRSLELPRVRLIHTANEIIVKSVFIEEVWHEVFSTP